ncbi:MAG TPA: histidine phosphatase family protein [Caulobacteraceae bacterium]|nr:histidine phosphatase family protein [Caulobacteraceae bacterium]
MARIYLIRHGRPSSTWGGADGDPGLDAIGATQAAATARRLLALPPPEWPTTVVSSPLRRCRQTAAPLAEALGVAVVIEPAVGEIPTPAGLAAEARPRWLRTSLAGRWTDIVGDLDYDAWRGRVTEAVAARPGAAVFSHFVAINAVLSRISGADQVVGFRPDHASVTVLELGEGGLIVVDPGREAATGIL